MGTLTFQAALGGSVNLLGPNTASNINFTLPSADGTSGQPLQTNGSGTLSFANLAIANGGTGATSFTANQIHYGSFSQSAGLTYDGTNLTTTGSFNSINTFGFKNRIINGGMVIDQRNAGAAVTAQGFTVDRFAVLISQASKLTVQQNAGSVTPPVGFINYLGVTSSSAYSVTSSDAFTLVQPVEGLNVSDFAWGTANASSVTLSFRVYSSLTGTFGGALKNSANTRSYPFSYSIPTANTWTQISITIAGDTTGTWLTTNGIGIQVKFGLGVGSTLSGTSGAWAATNYDSATGAVSVVGTSGATFYITGVQLEKGSTATSFDYRPYGTELALCQRYYEVCYLALSGTSLWTPGATIPFAVTKRTTPTMTYLSTISSSNFTLPNAFADIQIYAATGYATATSATNSYARTLNSASAEL